MNRFGRPLIVIVVTSLLMYLLRTLAYFPYKDLCLTVVMDASLFVFGVYLNGYKSKKGDKWLKKLLIIACFVCFVLIQQGMVQIPMVTKILNMIGATNIIFDMFYIYFGFIFF